MTEPPSGTGRPAPGSARSEVALGKAATALFPNIDQPANAQVIDAASPELRLNLQRQAVEVAWRYFAKRQSGPKAGSREGDYIAPLLKAAANTLRRLEEAAS